MAWHWTGDKPLSEPMMTQFTDAYKRYSPSMIYLYKLHLKNYTRDSGHALLRFSGGRFSHTLYITQGHSTGTGAITLLPSACEATLKTMGKFNPYIQVEIIMQA